MKIILSTIFVLLLSLTAFSQEKAQSSISPEKRALIAEFITLTKMEQMMEDSTNTMLEGIEMTYPSIVKTVLDKESVLNRADKNAMEKAMLERTQSVAKKYRERWKQYVNIKEYIEIAAYRLYDKYYTEDELRDINAFYRSATGQKVLQTSPEIMKEAMKISVELFVPQIKKLAEDIAAEEMNELKANLTTKRKGVK